LIDRPLEETLSELSLAPEINAVLRGTAPETDLLAGVFDLARAYELANWRRVEEIGERLGVPVSGFGDVYSEAVGWAQQVLEPVASLQPG
jgi:c-di-GMP-related signal transduction protein